MLLSGIYLFIILSILVKDCDICLGFHISQVLALFWGDCFAKIYLDYLEPSFEVQLFHLTTAPGKVDYWK